MPRKKTLTSQKVSFDLMSILKRSRPYERKVLLRHLDQPSVDSVGQFVYNALYTDLGLSRAAKRKLRSELQHSKRDLRFVADKSKRWDYRRRKLVQSGGAIGLILSSVRPYTYK